jgi:hypothetical protein
MLVHLLPAGGPKTAAGFIASRRFFFVLLGQCFHSDAWMWCTFGSLKFILFT